MLRLGSRLWCLKETVLTSNRTMIGKEFYCLERSAPQNVMKLVIKIFFCQDLGSVIIPGTIVCDVPCVGNCTGGWCRGRSIGDWSERDVPGDQ